MALATVDDVAARLGRTLTSTEEDRVLVLLDDASATVTGYTGQQFEQATTTARLTPRAGVVRLPQRPVTAVSAVVDMDGNPITYTWYTGDKVRLGTIDTFDRDPLVNYCLPVDVTYTAGYEEVPADIVAVVCQIVGRAFGRPSSDAGITQETLGPASFTYGATAGAGPLGLLPDERAVLDRYRPHIGSIWLAS